MFLVLVALNQRKLNNLLVNSPVYSQLCSICPCDQRDGAFQGQYMWRWEYKSAGPEEVKEGEVDVIHVHGIGMIVR